MRNSMFEKTVLDISKFRRPKLDMLDLIDSNVDLFMYLMHLSM